MKNLLQEFKAFAMKGNVVDLAIAVIIGGAFGKIVSSLVENIITPFVGILLAGKDFSTLSFGIGDAQITYGAFIQSVFDFAIIAAVLFIIIKAMTTAQDKLTKKKPTTPEAPK